MKNSSSLRSLSAGDSGRSKRRTTRLEQIDERVERGVSVVRRSLAGREPGLLIGGMFGQRMHQPGFADSCFTGDEDDMSTAVDDSEPSARSSSSTSSEPPDQRGEAGVTERFQPRARVALVKHLVDLERRGNTLERRSTQRSAGEEAADELVRQRADHHGVRRCDALQAGRDVGGVAERHQLVTFVAHRLRRRPPGRCGTPTGRPARHRAVR